MALAELSNVLWRERELLEMLLFKLEQEQLVLATGRTRWLARTTREVEVVLEEVRRGELLRAAELSAVCAELGLDDEPSLKALVESVEEPWRGIFAAHRDAFLAMTAEISALAASNRELLSSGARMTYETLLAVGGTETYDPSGAAATAGARTTTIDRAF